MLAQLCIFLGLVSTVMLSSCQDENYGLGVALVLIALVPAMVVASSVIVTIAREIRTGFSDATTSVRAASERDGSLSTREEEDACEPTDVQELELKNRA